MAETFNHLPEVIRELEQFAGLVVRKAAFDVQSKAAHWAPIDTGFLKSSIYVRTTRESTYAKASQAGARKDEFQQMLPEIDPPENDHTAWVAVGASYGIYVEFGTSRMPAQPYLLPSAEAVRPSYELAWEELQDKLKAAGIR